MLVKKNFILDISNIEMKTFWNINGGPINNLIKIKYSNKEFLYNLTTCVNFLYNIY